MWLIVLNIHRLIDILTPDTEERLDPKRETILGAFSLSEINFRKKGLGKEYHSTI